MPVRYFTFPAHVALINAPPGKSYRPKCQHAPPSSIIPIDL